MTADTPTAREALVRKARHDWFNKVYPLRSETEGERFERLVNEAIDGVLAASAPDAERWPDTICNDIDKMLRQHIRWTRGDESEGVYIEGWRKAARAVEEYIKTKFSHPAGSASKVTDEMVEAGGFALMKLAGIKDDAVLLAGEYDGYMKKSRRVLEAALNKGADNAAQK